jgi:hypothetical protein
MSETTSGLRLPLVVTVGSLSAGDWESNGNAQQNSNSNKLANLGMKLESP